MKRVYVVAMRGLRRLLAMIGVLALLDRLAPRSRTALWLRSLVAIYDLDDLARLDVPWWTFAAADRVSRHLAATPSARVFEWGSGSSTLWLAQRASQVHSVEHDGPWAAQLAPRLSSRTSLMVVAAQRTESVWVGSQKPGYAGQDFTDYVAAIDTVAGDFDLIVIDGRAREACLSRALARLAPGGMIVFDNVDRERYRRAIRDLGDQVATTWTRGLTPTLPYPTRTALLTHRAAA